MKKNQNVVEYYETAKKIKSVKINDKTLNLNINESVCNLSGETLSSGLGVCLNIKNNQTKYISIKYLSHQVFENLKLSNKMKIDLLTLVYLGAELYNISNEKTLKKIEFDCNITYQIKLKCGLMIFIYENDAKSKKYFNILKNYKKSFESIQYTIEMNDYSMRFYNINDFTIYPSYAKKLTLYHLGLGYNPNSKKDCIQTW